MSEQPRRALVAGGAGFLGSHLCTALLKDGWIVTCFDSLLTGNRDNLTMIADHPRFAFIEGDVVDDLPPAITGSDYEEIYNLAAAASPPAYQRDPEHTLITSVIGTRNLLRLAERTGARFLLTSTSEIYGDPLQHPQVESYWGNVNPIGPRACYDEGKRAAETLAFDFQRGNRVDVRVARIFNTYGPRLDPLDGRVVSNLVTQALAGRALTLHGTGSQTRSFCFVDDMIAGLIALMRFDGPQPGPVNLGNPMEVTVLELAQRVSALTDSASLIVHLPLPVDDPQRRRPDIARARSLLGWEPNVSLDDGLRSTIRWFNDQAAGGIQPALSVPTARYAVAQ